MTNKAGKWRAWLRVSVALICGFGFFYLGRWGMEDVSVWACTVSVIGMLAMSIYILLSFKSKGIVLKSISGGGFGGWS